MAKIPIVPVVRSHIDMLEPRENGEAELRGWIFRLDTRISRLEVALGGRHWTSIPSLYDRADVRAAYDPLFGSYPHILSSGFDVTTRLPDGARAGPNTLVDITPYTPDGARLDSLHSYFCPYDHELLTRPQPPINLQERIGGSTGFIHIAAQIATLVLTYIGKHKPVSEWQNVLDWGCGCGRVIAQLMKFVPSERLNGCDIDSAAIAWDETNLPGPNFVRVEPYPPTNYPDDAFDVIYGISVMTHLDETTQFLWLNELKRIAKPGAVIALSVMGEKLRTSNMPSSLTEKFQEDGFAAFVPNYSELLLDFSHKDYYQEAFHTLEYITGQWNKYFEVVEYIETLFQDLVILRKT